jgi:RNA polymerase sigma-70 factor (ECF subfamily)
MQKKSAISNPYRFHNLCGFSFVLFCGKTKKSCFWHWLSFATLQSGFSKNSDWREMNMAYNKAKEERKWQLWKEAEEQQMRQLGVSEDTIEKLRVHDWSVFNADRRYYEKLQETGTYLEEVAESDTLSEIKTVDDFLDSIENEYLYQMLTKADRITLQVAFLKIQGFSYREIALRLDTTEKSVYRRMDRLKEKMKKILK